MKSDFKPASPTPHWTEKRLLMLGLMLLAWYLSSFYHRSTPVPEEYVQAVLALQMLPVAYWIVARPSLPRWGIKALDNLDECESDGLYRIDVVCPLITGLAYLTMVLGESFYLANH